MSTVIEIRQLLDQIPPVMQEAALWRNTSPDVRCFESQQPFFLDTLAAEEWLQWVFLPRMFALLEGGHPLPTRIAITPYFEEALQNHSRDVMPLLALLQKIDDLLNKDGL